MAVGQGNLPQNLMLTFHWSAKGNFSRSLSRDFYQEVVAIQNGYS
jgi:hypothetical protein